MSKAKRVVIIAGESSGDLHAASLVNKLNKGPVSFEFSGIGGVHMQRAGVKVIDQLAKHGVTGFTEVVKKFPVIRRAFKQIHAHIENTKPDLVILIDYPGFNLRLAKALNNRVPILYYISPQIWAWKAGRIKTIKQYISQMAVILPFEKALYHQHQVPVHFVGHPLLDNLEPDQKSIDTLQADIKASKEIKLIALLPGSRENEINRLLPELLIAAKELSKRHQTVRFILPVAETISMEMITKHLKACPLKNLDIIQGKAREALKLSTLAIVASGTASLECALLATPMVVVYKISAITYLIAAKVIKVRFISLANIILNAPIAPELIQADCTGKHIALAAERLLNSEKKRHKMIQHFKQLANNLSVSAIDCTLEDSVLQLCQQNTQQIEKTT